MKKILSLLIFAFLTTATFAKGGSGTYFIKGTAYGADKIALKNAELTVTIGKETKIIITDNKGQFEIEINWATACPSGITRKRWKRETERINPNYIYIKSENKEIKIKNEWHKYAKLFPESKDKVTMKQNLNFL